jgi:hypothetical protein
MLWHVGWTLTPIAAAKNATDDILVHDPDNRGSL